MIRESIILVRNNKRLVNCFVILFIVGISIPALAKSFSPDPYADYDLFIIPFVKHCDVTQYPQRDGIVLNPDNTTAVHNDEYKPTRDPLKWWFNCVSYRFVGSAKLIPVLFNIGLMPLVYLLSLTLTKDRLVSLIALVAFGNNPLYYNWISSGTYDQVWSFFLVLAVLIIFRLKDYDTSTLSFVLSFAAKTLAAAFLPALLFSIFRSGKDRNKNIKLVLLLSAGLFITTSVMYSQNNNLIGGDFAFHPENIQVAAWGNWEMFWIIIPFLMIFTLISVNFRPSSPSKFRGLCGIWIINSLLTTPLIFLFTNQIQFVYRFVPLAVFMSIFIAITINDAAMFFIENKVNRLPKERS